jgi:hypothetical protein
LPHKSPDVIYVSGNPNFNETIRIQLEARMSTTVEPLPHLRFEIPEAARILRISRATLYERIREGLITTQKRPWMNGWWARSDSHWWEITAFS